MGLIALRGAAAGTVCRMCHDHFHKETDIMDVWFDSAHPIWHSWKASGAGLAVDMYLEGSDQHRGWFQASLLTSVPTGKLQ